MPKSSSKTFAVVIFDTTTGLITKLPPRSEEEVVEVKKLVKAQQARERRNPLNR